MRMRVLVGAVVALALAACTAPSRQYIAADRYGMYFSLPISWESVPRQQLQRAETGWSDEAGQVLQQTLLWQGAWSAQASDGNQVFAAKAPGAVMAYAFVRSLIPVEQQAVGDDLKSALRDIVIPASSIVAQGGTVRTQRVNRGGFEGIRQVATYASGGSQQTVDVTSVLGPQRDRLYSLSIRCTTSCFAAQRQDIDAIVGSLTFKEIRGN